MSKTKFMPMFPIIEKYEELKDESSDEENNKQTSLPHAPLIGEMETSFTLPLKLNRMVVREFKRSQVISIRDTLLSYVKLSKILLCINIVVLLIVLGACILTTILSFEDRAYYKKVAELVLTTPGQVLNATKSLIQSTTVSTLRWSYENEYE